MSENQGFKLKLFNVVDFSVSLVYLPIGPASDKGVKFHINAIEMATALWTKASHTGTVVSQVSTMETVLRKINSQRGYDEKIKLVDRKEPRWEDHSVPLESMTSLDLIDHILIKRSDVFAIVMLDSFADRDSINALNDLKLKLTIKAIDSIIIRMSTDRSYHCELTVNSYGEIYDA